MASTTNNPYLRMKKALKGKKISGGEVHDMMKKKISHTGSFHGKSNKLGQGGRAAQLKAQGVPSGVIGNLARAAHAAPGQKNFHKKKKAPMPAKQDLGMAMKKKGSKKYPTTNRGEEGDVEHKKAHKPHKGRKHKNSIGMMGDIEHKSAKRSKTKKKASVNQNSPANYGKAMSSAYQATYGKVPTAKSVTTKGSMGPAAAYAYDADNTYANSSPSMARSTPQAILKKRKGGKKKVK